VHVLNNAFKSNDSIVEAGNCGFFSLTIGSLRKSDLRATTLFGSALVMGYHYFLVESNQHLCTGGILSIDAWPTSLAVRFICIGIL